MQHVTSCHKELPQCNADFDVYLQIDLRRKSTATPINFNETKMNAFYKDDGEYLKLLDLAQN